MSMCGFGYVCWHVCVCAWVCIYVYACVRIPEWVVHTIHESRCKQRSEGMGPLERESHVFVSHLIQGLRTKLWCSGRALSALNCWDNFSGSCYDCFKSTSKYKVGQEKSGVRLWSLNSLPVLRNFLNFIHSPLSIHWYLWTNVYKYV